MNFKQIMKFGNASLKNVSNILEKVEHVTPLKLNDVQLSDVQRR